MKTNLKLITTCLTCVLLLVACKNEVKEEIAKIEKTPGINLNWMNQDISPEYYQVKALSLPGTDSNAANDLGCFRSDHLWDDEKAEYKQTSKVRVLVHARK